MQPEQLERLEKLAASSTVGADIRALLDERNRIIDLLEEGTSIIERFAEKLAHLEIHDELGTELISEIAHEVGMGGEEVDIRELRKAVMDRLRKGVTEPCPP